MSKIQSKDPIIARLATIIRGMRLKPKEVMNRTGISKATYYRIMSGKKGTMFFRTVARIVTGLGARNVPLIEKVGAKPRYHSIEKSWPVEDDHVH